LRLCPGIDGSSFGQRGDESFFEPLAHGSADQGFSGLGLTVEHTKVVGICSALSAIHSIV
jgi:hypothetical protein